jgi:hypothetical protein
MGERHALEVHKEEGGVKEDDMGPERLDANGKSME